MKRRFGMTVDVDFTKQGCDGSGEELRDEMKGLEAAVQAAIVTRVGRQMSGTVTVRVTLGESEDA